MDEFFCQCVTPINIVIDELANLIASTPDLRELKRTLTVSLTLRGYIHKEIMVTLQVSSGFISKWKQTFVAKGVEQLHARPFQIRHSELSSILTNLFQRRETPPR